MGSSPNMTFHTVFHYVSDGTNSHCCLYGDSELHHDWLVGCCELLLNAHNLWTRLKDHLVF
jgi:hypothetical protein